MSLPTNKPKTPYLSIDTKKVIANYNLLKTSFPNTEIFYALKANSHKEVIKTLHSVGCSFEINNQAELNLLKSVRIQNDRIINSLPVKSGENISLMKRAGIDRLAFDSKEELENILRIFPKAKLYLRIHTSNLGSGQELNTKFGCNHKEAIKLLEKAKGVGIEVFGLTFSVGSQCENLNNWKEGFKKCGEIFAKFPSLTTINIGGGFPISFESPTISIKEIAKVVESSLKQYFPKPPALFLEPGRFLVGNAGTMTASVIGVKNSLTPKWAFIDVSVFGGFLEVLEFKKGLRYPVHSKKKGRLHLYNIAGPTCDGCDIIIKEALLPLLKVGDVIYFENTGAYTLEYGSNFNGYPMPKAYFS
jgi:ornithine decarboxylase